MQMNILQQSNVDNTYPLRLKIKYLQQDKDKLQVCCKQMKQNITILRQVNKQLSQQTTIGKQAIYKNLNEQVQSLQKSYLRAQQQSDKLSCQNLMYKQVLEQSQTQYKNIIKGYESKIIELRRSIQFKQSCIQSYEQNSQLLNNNYQLGNIPPSNVSLVFFSQIDEYKNTIERVQKQNNYLKKQLQDVKSKNTQLSQQNILMRSLFQSRDSYIQVKSRINQQNQKLVQEKKVKSQQKYNEEINTKLSNIKGIVQPPQSTHYLKKTKEQIKLQQQTNSSTMYQPSGKINQLKQLLKKKSKQCDQLHLKYKHQNIKNKQYEQKLKLAINSNKYYKEKRTQKIDQLNYYKRSAADLISLLMKKKVISGRGNSAQRLNTQKFIAEIKKPEQFSIIENRKKFWVSIQQQINMLVNSKNLFLNFDKNSDARKYRRLKRSFSDILTYTKLNHDNDKMDKYLVKNQNMISRKQNSSKFQKSDKQPNDRFYQTSTTQNDFSCLLGLGANGQIFDQQSLIIKPKIMSYADRKKLKAKKVSSSNMNNLTIIQENVL